MSAKSGAKSNARRAERERTTAELIERFAEAARLLRLPVSGRLVVAASGGADSGAALLLLRAVAPDADIMACYVDHGIRPRASVERDIKAVRAQARAARARVVVRRVRPGGNGSPEERARIARYRVLTRAARAAGAGYVVTGHQQDDLIETTLLALARGSGIDGVAAMRPARSLAEGIVLVRPLLWATKHQCESLLAAAELSVSHDETNDDRSMPRNAVRKLAGELERALPGASHAIARSAALLSDDKALLDGLSLAAWRSAHREDALRLSVATLRRMPLALLRRVIRRAVVHGGTGLRDFTYEHCNAIANAIKQRRGGRFHAGAATVVLSAGTLAVDAHAQPSASSFSPVTIDLERLPVVVSTPTGRASLRIVQSTHHASATGAQHLDVSALRAAGSLQIRLPRTGDTCVPTGRTKPISLARFLAKAGVMRSERASAALLCAGGRIAAVLGVRVMEPFKPKKMRAMLEVTWNPADM